MGVKKHETVFYPQRSFRIARFRTPVMRGWQGVELSLGWVLGTKYRALLWGIHRLPDLRLK